MRLRKYAKPLVPKCNGVPDGVFAGVVQRKDEKAHGKGRRRHYIGPAGGGTDDGTCGHTPNERIPRIALPTERLRDAFRRRKGTRRGTEQESWPGDGAEDGPEFRLGGVGEGLPSGCCDRVGRPGSLGGAKKGTRCRASHLSKCIHVMYSCRSEVVVGVS